MSSNLLRENGHSLPLSDYRNRLKNWGRENLRDLPWRETRKPYRILIAEFMLLRTQARQVAPVYKEFIAKYPTLNEAVEASREEVHDLLAPLGLKWRADRVYETLQELKEKHNLSVPSDREVLIDLPGISQYIAGAVRCFAFGKSDALVDTNTVRIAGRLFGLEIKSSSRRTNQFQRLISELVDPDQPRLYNLSMLDLGAERCTSRSPRCQDCPLSQMCVFGQSRLG